MISTNFKLIVKSNGKMLNFVEGYKATLGLGPIYWSYWIPDYSVDRAQWKKETIHNDLVEKVHPLEINDDTTWGMLSPREMEYWIAKGFNFDTWKGKPIFVHDVVKFVCEGKEDTFVVVKMEHLYCFKDKNLCMKDIPCHREKCKMYVVGNEIQNEHLVADFKEE